MDKIFTAAIVGCGGRGCEAYGKLFYELKDKYKVNCLCDVNEKKLDKYSKMLEVPLENCFDDEDEFFAKKRADICVIATLDKDHVRQAIKALKVGYDILLEKPITDDVKECKKLLKAQQKYGGKVLVCHVLRYAPAYIKTAELLNSGTIGRLVAIQAIERVTYWHQAHSYVRGNWRNTKDTTPMILAKCCHDLDLLQYYANSSCTSVSSVGDLTFFNKQNKPKDASDRCLSCKYVDTCPYSAKCVYLDGWKKNGCQPNDWPYNVVTMANPLTEDAILEGIKNGPYGRCVFECDNNAVDHQIVEMTFNNGVKASLTMTGFTATGGRIYSFYGTYGELVLDENVGVIKVRKFNQEEEIISLDNLAEGGHSHGGGDYGIVTSLYDMLSGKANFSTSLKASIESHLMGIFAEKSRLNGGKTYKIH